MKIFLFRPNSEVITALPPLGFLSLAAYFRKFGNHEVKIYDGRLYCATNSDIQEQIEDFQPDIIGIGLLSMERQVGHRALMSIRENFTHIPLVMGGPYPTSEPLDAMQNPVLDFIVIGEGEIVAQNLLQKLEKGEDFSSLKGIGYRRGGEIKLNDREAFIQNLDDLPLNAWDLISLPDYFRDTGRTTQMNIHKKFLESAPIMTTRGCPYQCTYCHNLMGRKIRHRSVLNVINELKYLKDNYNIREIEIVDDAFNVSIKRANELLRAIIAEKLNLNFSFPNGLRADCMTEETISLMKQAGVYRLVYAVESGSPKIQKEMRKNLDLEKTQKIIAYTARQNISIGSFYMLGFLNETEEDMMMTLNFAFKSKAHTASFFLLNPFPNTEIYQQAREAGKNLQDVRYIHYYSLCANISQVSNKRILQLRNYAYRRFFLNPIRIYHFFRTTPSRIFFFKKVLIALYMFFVQIENEKKSAIGADSSEGIHNHNLLLKLIYAGTGLNKLDKEAKRFKIIKNKNANL